MDIRAFSRNFLEAILPRPCVLCGNAVEAAQGWPICGPCEGALNRIRGERCPMCGKGLISEIGACMRCRTRDYGFDGAISLHAYAGSVKELISRYKFGRRRDLAPFFANELAQALSSAFPGRPVVPVPPRPGKIRKTGWDQVELIAVLLERRHGIGVHRALCRNPAGEQKGLGQAERFENAKNAFRRRTGVAVPVDPVLIDDVFTTGATLSACATALKSAGALRVDAIAIAAD